MNKFKKSNRRILREKVLQILYAMELNSDAGPGVTNQILGELNSKMDMNFARLLINSVIENKNELEEIIIKKISNWEVDRIALIDRLLLRIGVAEMLYFDEIPPKVTINEMIEISKEYSTAKSAKFINGILDAILYDLKKNGRLKKSGRGLIDKTLHKKS